MQIVICDNAHQVADKAAMWLTALINKKNNAVLGLATGSTPIKLYQQLVSLYQQGNINFNQVTSFNLDEYYQIDPNNPQSYRSFMQQHLFDHININAKNTHFPSCSADENPREVGLAYEKKISQAGGIDLQILGLGSNGHIGFNEPATSLSSRTRVETLTKQTVRDNSRFFNPEEYQPEMAITMGIATIMDARHVLLMATGENKAHAVHKMVAGPVSAMCPASVLQKHKNAIILLDKKAANQLGSGPINFRASQSW